MWQSQVENNISVGGVIDIQTAYNSLKFTVHVRSSIIHKGTQNDFNEAFLRYD